MLLSQRDGEGHSIIGVRDISVGPDTAALLPGIFLLFPKGDRPSRKNVIDRFAGSNRIFVSHDPHRADQRSALGTIRNERSEDDCWLEVLCDGLTFDLLGLDGGPPLAPGETAYSFGTGGGPDPADLEAVGLFPGPHLCEGANSLPVVRTMLAIAMEMLDEFTECRLLVWSPARAAMSPDFLCRVGGEWLEGGAFPALGMVGYHIDEDGALLSEGLAFLVGSEIAIAPKLARDRIGATRLAVRIVHLLVGSEPLRHVLTFEFEERALVLRPDQDRHLIHIEPA